ncbi:hypothetical protein TRFO_24462 [Tritrichomonas foetus]|uniref:DUF4456 domain-containing protein n=1 Tax=Tritrichomonas foetus TaxID=1144522 RepID=A0A1J4K916_9EUKA|nr:hypothetical protein TRFO_24462 [Tritrichomonas foetus]|eukprot:OHT07376.1 hypothetical protein TRFO_24462 [Tritrichomonas foetus]
MISDKFVRYLKKVKMIDVEKEVALLPKTVSDEQTSANGALRRYQEKLVEQYLSVLSTFQKSTKDIAIECQNQLKARMNLFANQSNELKAKQESILSTLGTTSFTFDELKNQVNSIGENLILLSQQLREDIFAIYTGSFSKLKPVVDNAFSSCEVFLPQIPHQYSEKLPFEVKRLNESFLQTKQHLIQTMYTIEMSCREHALNINSQFIQRADEWKQNRFTTIVEEARKQLDPFNPIDFGTLYHDFHVDQSKFTHCFKKIVSNLALFSPPEHFNEGKLDEWWKEVTDILECHKNFITQFLSKFQEKVEERNQTNSQLVSSLEKELFELAPETDASQAMSELMPLYKQSQKYNNSLIEKLSKYWTARSESLLKTFESIRDFLKPLIDDYQKFIAETDENHQFVSQEMNEITNSSDSTINQLETELEQKSNEILVLVGEKDIQNHVVECKQILEKIEKQFHESYDKIISTFDTQPSLVCTLYEKIETNILNILKMKKTANSTEFEATSSFIGSLDQKKKSASLRSGRRAMKPKMDTKIGGASSFAFQTVNGAKYEEICSLELIPLFDDFLDEPSTPTSAAPARGGKGGGRGKNTPNRGRRGGAKPPARGKGGKGKTDDYEDVDAPEFILSEVVPKESDGTVSVWVYIPVNEEINEWLNNFRKTLISSICDEFTNRMRRASYSEERERLTDELNERMRVHAPRANAIELNVAQKRVNQIESRQAQLEKHFIRTTANFNKGISNLYASLEKRKALMTAECNKLKVFTENLEKQKATSSFSVVIQNFEISNKHFNSYFEKQTNDQNKEIENFITNFYSVNERFMKSVVLGNNSFSEEEKAHSNEYFERMKTSVEGIINDLKAKSNDVTNEITKLRSSVLEEFESALPHHKADVGFIETLRQIQHESKTKYEALLSRNKLMEADVERTLNNLVINENVDSQAKLIDLLKKLDDARISIIKRGIFLSIMKSKIEPEPIDSSLDLIRDTKSPKKTDRQGSTTPIDGKHSKSRSKQGKDSKPSKTQAPNSSEKAQLNKSGKQQQPQQDINSPNPNQSDLKNLTFKQQFDQFTEDYNNSINKVATEYYNNLKTRKLPITRPNIIHAQQNECIEACEEILKKSTQDFLLVVKDSCLRYRTQVQNSENIARELQKSMYHIFTMFYTELVAKDRAEAQINFDEEMKKLAKQRNTNKSKMSPDLADLNKLNELKQLIDSENDRSSRELECINNYSQQIVDCETKGMNMFSLHLPDFTQKLLSLFDKFVQKEDLVNGESTNISRKTMRELMKDKGRRSVAANNDPNGRPFHTRDWPTLSIVMDPIINQTICHPSTPSQNRQSDSHNSNRSVSLNKKKKPTKSGLLPIEEPVQQTQAQQMPILNSLDTSLNRGVIVERNNGYSEYETALGKRLDDFAVYLQTLKEETDAFSRYWTKCIYTLNPNLAKNIGE